MDSFLRRSVAGPMVNNANRFRDLNRSFGDEKDRANDHESELSTRNEKKYALLQDALSKSHANYKELQGQLQHEREERLREKTAAEEEQNALRVLTAKLAQRLRDAFDERDALKQQIEILQKNTDTNEYLSKNIEHTTLEINDGRSNMQHPYHSEQTDGLLEKSEHAAECECLKKQQRIDVLEEALQREETELVEFCSKIRQHTLNTVTDAVQEGLGLERPREESTMPTSTENGGGIIEEDDSKSPKRNELIQQVLGDLEQQKSRIEYDLVRLCNERNALRTLLEAKGISTNNGLEYVVGPGIVQEIKSERDRLAILLKESEAECFNLEQRLEQQEQKFMTVSDRARRVILNQSKEIEANKTNIQERSETK